LLIKSCKAPRLFVISTSSTTTKTFFVIMHCLISSRYSSTSSCLCNFLSHKSCRSFFGHLWCVLISHPPKS
jgi:hypothetical protein